MKKSDLLENLWTCNEVYRLYKNILDTYIADFYLEQHWEILPNSWKNYFEKLPMEELVSFLKGRTPSVNTPLSILCLQKILSIHVLPRKAVNFQENRKFDKEFTKLLWKGVKLKKRHEIPILANNCYDSALKTDCFYIIDIGSGLGHLSRLLSFGYGFKVCTFEADKTLSQSAKMLDEKFNEKLNFKNIKHKQTFSTVHVHKRIEDNISPMEFLKLVSKNLEANINILKFGIVGLHPCGNLGVTLLRLFHQCSNVVFVNIVGCCYMKLTTEPSVHQGFPISRFCELKKVSLDYLSCELACHALESYVERLENNEIAQLKVHAFRAALESVLVKIDSNLKHSQIASVKYVEGITFLDYCQKATRNMVNVELKLQDIEYFEKVIKGTWLNVAKFYTIRLAMAPLLESIILYDRVLFCKELGNNECEMIPVFDSRMSPRNSVLSARKFVVI